MFRRLGNVVSHAWPLFLVIWIGGLTTAWKLAPPWAEVAVDDDDTLLDATSASRQADEMFRRAFPDEIAASNIAIVLHRSGSKGSQVEADRKFIADVLEPALRKAIGLNAAPVADTSASPFATDSPAPVRQGPVTQLRTPNATGVGELLISPDREAMLVIVELSTGFLAESHDAILHGVKQCLVEVADRAKAVGLQLNLTGSAIVGADQRQAEQDGARSTEKLTIAFVVVLLLLIYRAPLLALVPLLTVAIAVETSLAVLALLAHAKIVGLFPGIEVYVTILSYGAGVDFSLFLIARYKEELDSGLTMEQADSKALGAVGSTIAASALTVICGLATLSFAEFGKFRQAGIAITLCLSFVGLAALTLTPALMRLFGRWIFWPRALNSAPTPAPVTRYATDPCDEVYPKNFRWGWQCVISMIVCRPKTVLLATVVMLLPFALLAIACRDRLNYNLIGNLPSTAPSVAGTQALKAHFPGGMEGPVDLLIVDKNQDFRKPQGRELIRTVTDRLNARRQELGLAEVRSVTAPLGFGPAATQLSQTVSPEAMESLGVEAYVSSLGESGARATRLALVFQTGPFLDETIDALRRTEAIIRESIPSSGVFYTSGITATIRDLQEVMRRDRARVERLVLAGVFVVLLVMLRQVIVPVFLLASVLLSYFATLGVTFLVFWAIDPSGFIGLDWKVSVFLFAILIAVGEDYNIFLVARVAEEQVRFGHSRGVAEALIKTGPIISSCGIIMAGTFASLIAGSLREMQQLGFALAFGVLLDTFLVRPIMVPAFLAMRYGKKRTAVPANQESNIVAV